MVDIHVDFDDMTKLNSRLDEIRGFFYQERLEGTVGAVSAAMPGPGAPSSVNTLTSAIDSDVVAIRDEVERIAEGVNTSKDSFAEQDVAASDAVCRIAQRLGGSQW